jgi:hypothetical protein
MAGQRPLSRAQGTFYDMYLLPFPGNTMAITIPVVALMSKLRVLCNWAP